jgi:hypothetical protein
MYASVLVEKASVSVHDDRAPDYERDMMVRLAPKTRAMRSKVSAPTNAEICAIPKMPIKNELSVGRPFAVKNSYEMKTDD